MHQHSYCYVFLGLNVSRQVLPSLQCHTVSILSTHVYRVHYIHYLSFTCLSLHRCCALAACSHESTNQNCITFDVQGWGLLWALWVIPPQEDFYASLAKIQGIVSKPILSQEELDLLDGKAGQVFLDWCYDNLHGWTCNTTWSQEDITVFLIIYTVWTNVIPHAWFFTFWGSFVSTKCSCLLIWKVWLTDVILYIKTCLFVNFIKWIAGLSFYKPI